VKNVVGLGSGFAGLWATVGAARRLNELHIPTRDVRVTVISSQPFHDIRVRNYESDLSECRIPLSAVLDPIGVAHITADVTAIDTTARTIAYSGSDGFGSQDYDRLVFALGSSVARPALPGLREFGFDIDTYDQAVKLSRHLASLADGPPTSGAATAIVVGAGLTGIEAACELPGRLAGLFSGRDGFTPRVLLIDHNPFVGSDMGDSARPLIEAALADNGVETLTGVGVTALDAEYVTLSNGQRVAAATVVWCAGMRANPLTALFGIELDRLGRLPVDDFLQVVGAPGAFAAGDVAAAMMDDQHVSVMSCQHGRPMGRYAGHNVVSDLLGEPMLELRIPWYVTVLDLGPAGALYTEGWDRQVVAHGAQAKATKRVINTERIYPPLDGDRAKILAAAAPELQARPARG
jgi:NADH dehydrogenase